MAKITIIKATEGKYLTQSATLEDESTRMFVRQIAGFNVIESDWREAEESEKTAWEAEYLPEEPTDEL